MKIRYTYTALKQLEAFPLMLQRRIIGKMIFYSQQPDPVRLAKFIHTFKCYRFRIGDYRILFEVINETIIVRIIDRRDKVYD